MKHPFIPTCLTAATLLVAPALFAGSPRGASTASVPQRIFSLSERDLERQVTVSDLLGKSVVGANDERIGSLHDVDLTELFTGGARVASGAGAGSGELTFLIRPETGADLLSVPSQEVNYDQRRDSLTLTASVPADATSSAPSSDQGEREGLAPADVAVNDPANTIEPVAVAAVPGSDIEVATTGAEVLEIEEALARHTATSQVADQINVLSSNDAILLTGSLETEEQRELVLEVAREASEREVRDLLQVAAE